MTRATPRRQKAMTCRQQFERWFKRYWGFAADGNCDLPDGGIWQAAWRACQRANSKAGGKGK